MPGAIGVNLRVTGHSSQGGRKYMEDFFSVAYQQSEDECDLEFAFFGIFDGHGGAEAAAYAKEHLMRQIVSQKHLFWSDNDADVLRAIREGYMATHKAMWREQEKWPRTATGLPSTAGTTATVAFIRHGKMYIGHVGDSGIVLGYEDPVGALSWRAKPLTEDHKPESDVERSRIMSSGGKVVAKSGVSRVVWTRPRLGHKGPIRRSTPIDEIPFLAVARSLGDLWSYNSQHNEFVVSPEPDVMVVPIEKGFRCLVFGTDGLWNVMSPSTAVDIVRSAEYTNDRNYYCSKELLNPSRSLVNRALEKWSTTRIRADNTSVVTILLDPPGGPKRKQFAATSPMNNNRQQVVGHQQQQQQQQVMGGGAQQQVGGGHYDDWHTMEEECLNSAGERMRRSGGLETSTSATSTMLHPPSSARNVEEELDLLNESLYNHTHQFNQMDIVGGGDFNLLASPPPSASSSSAHVHYENYMHLTHTHHHGHQFTRLPPPGGFLQSHLQGTPQLMQSMALQFMSDDENSNGSGDYDQNNGSLMEAGGSVIMDHPVHSFSQPHDVQHHNQHQHHLLPTFSHLMEDTAAAAASTSASYSLTRLETRMEQLSNSAQLYANYQQLIETSSYTPQIDLATINTFHDYAGIPQAQPQIQQAEEEEEELLLQEDDDNLPTSASVNVGYDEGGASVAMPLVDTTAADQQHLSYAMDNEKFGWSQEWHQEPAQNLFVPVNSSSVELNREATEGEVVSEDEEAVISSNVVPAASPEVEELPQLDDYSTPLSPTIQIHEITSSGVVPTPPPQLIMIMPAKEGEEEDNNEERDSEMPKSIEVGDDKPISIAAVAEQPQTNNATRSERVNNKPEPIKLKLPTENLRRRLRCPVSSSSSSTSEGKEKENCKSDQLNNPPAAKCRRLQAPPPPSPSAATLAVTTRSATTTITTTTTPAVSVAVVPCVSTRKSTAAAALLKSVSNNNTSSVNIRRRNNISSSSPALAIKSSLRSKQAASSVKTKSPDQLILKCNLSGKRNLLINSNKFNQQTEASDDPGLGKKAAATEAAVGGSKPEVASSSSSGIGRRLSKRDKVRNNNNMSSKTVAVLPTSASWTRSVVTKSTVQTRNRVQKR